jgi:hypothetical protein
VTAKRTEIALRIAAVMALLGLAFMVWAVLVPTPMPVVLAMSVGQGLGTLSLLIFGAVVLSDLRRRRILDDDRGEGKAP